MIDSLYIGASGLVAHQQALNTISNNLANMNTPAYKKVRMAFRELFENQVQRASDVQGSDASAALAMPLSPSGVSVGSTQRVFNDGDVQQSDSNLDLAIRGTGFFEVELPDGTSAFTRNGNFVLNADRLMTTPEGYVLKQQIQIPQGATNLTIGSDGTVNAQLDATSAPEQIGEIELTQFVNPSGLKPLGGDLFLPTEQSGDAEDGKPGTDGLGLISQGFLETSNVKLVDELVALMVAQRGYEASSKVVQVSDDILGMANNLRR